MNIILLGAPFSGKGTLAKQLEKNFGLKQLSTGDLLRENIANKAPVGLKAKKFMDKGSLVPDEIVVEMISQRIKQKDCKRGVILDGFPRTVSQAKSLEKIAKIDTVILLDVSKKTLLSRVSGRRVCSGCGEIYNTNSYKKLSCSKCGAPLYQRDDDKLETVEHRLEVYESQTAPLIDFYAEKLCKVSGEKSPEDTYCAVKKHLNSLGAKSC